MLHERWPDVPRIALTATATQATREEIAIRLKLAGSKLFVSSFDRPNIQYRIVPKNEPKQQLLPFLQTEHRGDAGIVYCLSRDSTEKIAQFLTEHGIPALPYHAGLDAAPRRISRGSCAKTAWSSSRRSRSAWGSTSPTCASSPTWTCRARSRATTRRPAGRAGTGSRRPRGSPTAWPTSSSSGG